MAQFREAICLHEKCPANAHDPSSGAGQWAAAYFQYALLLSQDGRVAKARTLYDKGLAWQPESAVANNKLAWLLATRPDRKLLGPARAVALARKATTARPRESNYWNTLGTAPLPRRRLARSHRGAPQVGRVGAKGTLVWVSTDTSWKWRIIGGARRCRLESGSTSPAGGIIARSPPTKG